ncbi:MAG TPA: 1-deoxy-D-xylulose-5-phosphate reductoisomerase [Bacteroidales bacterium]|nr:1-deoxy-D-xylulose-5-phosphate reductoisomerase [Bacteroidales bacterium]HRZ22070.1 1-deoxy-D-xylulose-5-phosphate reductoisomerase [Bacteroidales bacterium]
MKKKGIAILGSTGSIGQQALDVICHHRDWFELELITAHKNADILIRQAIQHLPNAVVITDPALYSTVRDALRPYPVKVYAGEDALLQALEMETIDMVLIAIVGFAGLHPTIRSLELGRQVALANKESLVVAGEIITRLSRDHHAPVIPVDSEHSAIYQCLAGEQSSWIEKIYLTASGGPFRETPLSEFPSITREKALQHPNWNMGDKITIDSATLMNKGLEVIEARWLFNLNPSQIQVVIHPQSVIHSMVQFCDGSIKAQMGVPDMRLPILYALGYPSRMPSALPRFDFAAHPALTFSQPDAAKFRNLALAYTALDQGGNMPCILNAANEAAVGAFLREEIPFTGIPAVIEQCMEKATFVPHPGMEDYIQTDKETRKVAEIIMNKYRNTSL